jgi:type I restriction enzyme R subunit
MLDGKRKLSLNRDLYFGIYQTLWSEDEQGKRLFEQFPRDFFDLVIIDEAHRSGFGTWREILDHFEGAIHLGMTATPKQDENIDTYDYFCREEPAIPVDPDDESKGEIHPPAYTYSLGQGIEDGFLATYKVHVIRTNLDKEGLHITEAIEKGAEVFVPEEAQLREDYYTPQFERDITLPDRTRAMVEHLSMLLRKFGTMHKTMVFCVDMDHAQEVARQLNNAFPELGFGDNYAVPIVSEEGEQGRRWLAQFQDSDKTLPVVATTAELLSTGVDVPSARNIVFMKTLSSPILFKQIIGRGTRVDPATGKLWFRIIDYTNATRLLDPRWDKPPTPAVEILSPEQQTACLTGTVRLAGTCDLLVGANVAVIAAPNDQRGPILTDGNGQYRFDRLPAGKLTVIASGQKLNRKQAKVVTQAEETTVLNIELTPASEKGGTIKAENLEVVISEEATFLVTGKNEPLTLDQYIDYSREKLLDLAPGWEHLKAAWQDMETRSELEASLNRASIYPGVLADVLEIPDADPFDVLAHVAYHHQIRTRAERASTFLAQEQIWLEQFPPEAREVILVLLEKYQIGGLRQITDPKIFRVSPFREMGELRGVIQRFNGDAALLRQTIDELQVRLYEH